MLLKKDLHERSAAIERSVGAPVNLSAPAAGIAPAKPRVAVFVAHGMGQQVPFETLDNIAEASPGLQGGTAALPSPASARAPSKSTTSRPSAPNST
jgi:hypothetical protein